MHVSHTLFFLKMFLCGVVALFFSHILSKDVFMGWFICCIMKILLKCLVSSRIV